MTLKRFYGESARDALHQVKAALGPEAIVISNKSVPGGVEILAMSEDSLEALQGGREGVIEQAANTQVPSFVSDESDYAVSLSSKARAPLPFEPWRPWQPPDSSRVAAQQGKKRVRPQPLPPRSISPSESTFKGSSEVDQHIDRSNNELGRNNQFESDRINSEDTVESFSTSYRQQSPPEFALSLLSGTRAETIAEEDCLDRGRLTSSLVRLLTERDDCAPFAIGLFGHWGAGKTTQVHLLKKALEIKLREDSQNLDIKFAEFNAWKNEKADKLGAMLAQAVVECLLERRSVFQRLRLAMQLASRRHASLRGAVTLEATGIRERLYDNFLVSLPLLSVAAALAMAWLWFPADYIGWKAIVTGALSTAGAMYLAGYRFIRDNLTDFFKHIGSDKALSLLSLPDYSGHHGLLGEIHRTLHHLCSLCLPGQSPKDGAYLLLVVDDLDRCSISAVKEVFDAIRLVADIPRVVTLIAIDERIAYAAVEKHYEQFGEIGRSPKLVAREYLSKVLRMSVTLPEVTHKDIAHFVAMTLFADKTLGPLAQTQQNIDEISKPIGSQANKETDRSTAAQASKETIYSLPGEHALFEDLAKAFRFSNPRLLGRLHLAWKVLKSLSFESTYSIKVADPLMRSLFWREWCFQRETDDFVMCDKWIRSDVMTDPSIISKQLALAMRSIRGKAELSSNYFQLVDAVILPGGAHIAQSELAANQTQVSWSDVTFVDVLGIEVGYRLIPLVDADQNGELLKRIRGLRKKFAQEVGFLSAPVHIRDNLELKPNGYRITLKGVEVGSGEAFPGMFLAINPGRVSGPLAGNPTTDPAFGLPAVWIEPAVRDQAHIMGYTVVDAGTVVATHLNHLIMSHAAELLGRQETQELLDHLSKSAPKLVEDLVPKILPLSTVQRVLQNLLEEGVNIRDMRSIIETLAENAMRVQDHAELTALVRIALGRSIVQQIYQSSQELQVMALEPGLERLLTQALQGAGTDGSGIEPGLADTLLRETAVAAKRQADMGLPSVLLVPSGLRWLLSRFLRRAWANLKVLSKTEIPVDRTIKINEVIGVHLTS